MKFLIILILTIFSGCASNHHIDDIMVEIIFFEGTKKGADWREIASSVFRTSFQTNLNFILPKSDAGISRAEDGSEVFTENAQIPVKDFHVSFNKKEWKKATVPKRALLMLDYQFEDPITDSQVEAYTKDLKGWRFLLLYCVEAKTIELFIHESKRPLPLSPLSISPYSEAHQDGYLLKKH